MESSNESGDLFEDSTSLYSTDSHPSLPPFQSLSESTSSTSNASSTYKAKRRKSYKYRKAIEKQKSRSELKYEMITATVTKKPKVGFGFQCVGLWGTVKKCDAEPERIRNGDQIMHIDRTQVYSSSGANTYMKQVPVGEKCLFFLRRNKEMPPTSPKETSESEFYLEKDENYEVIKKNLLIPTNRPTLGYAMNPRNSASQTDLMRWYETTQSLQSLQSQTREVIAENTCLRRKLKSVRDNYELLLHNLRLMNPAEPFLKYRDDIRNFNNNNL